MGSPGGQGFFRALICSTTLYNGKLATYSLCTHKSNTSPIGQCTLKVKCCHAEEKHINALTKSECNCQGLDLLILCTALYNSIVTLVLLRHCTALNKTHRLWK